MDNVYAFRSGASWAFEFVRGGRRYRHSGFPTKRLAELYGTSEQGRVIRAALAEKCGGDVEAPIRRRGRPRKGHRGYVRSAPRILADSAPANLAALGAPSLTFTGQGLADWRRPLVYAWLREGVVLYVGMSATGIDRPLARHHHRLCRIEAADQLLVWFMESVEQAAATEHALASRLAPLYNNLRQVSTTPPKPRGRTNGLSREGRSWRLEFVHLGRRYRFTLGRGISRAAAEQLAARKRAEVLGVR